MVDLNATASSSLTCYPFSTVWSYKDDLFTACIIASIVEVIFLIPITVENLLVVIGIYKTRSLHSPSNFLICALAFSDLGVGILALPFHLAWKSFLISDMYSQWCIAIRMAYGVGVLLAAVSLLTITAISIERTVALYMAFRYEFLVTNHKVFLFMIIAWVAMALLSLIQYYDLPAYRVTAAVISFVCSCVSSFCCFKIFQVVRHHRTQIDIQENASEYYISSIPSKETTKKTMKEKKRSSASMLVLYGLFLLCYSPYIGVQLALLVGVENFFVHASEIITVSIVFVNSVVNPLLYCWRMRDIRHAMLSVVPCALKTAPSILISRTKAHSYRNGTNNQRRNTRLSVSMLDYNNADLNRNERIVN